MSLREEVKEAMALVADGANLPKSANLIRNEKDDTWLGIKIARAALEVLDTYEEVEAWTGEGVEDKWLCLTAPPKFRSTGYTISVGPILRRKKQVPGPTAEELLQELSDEWKAGAGAGFCDKMKAVAERLEKP